MIKTGFFLFKLNIFFFLLSILQINAVAADWQSQTIDGKNTDSDHTLSIISNNDGIMFFAYNGQDTINLAVYQPDTEEYHITTLDESYLGVDCVAMAVDSKGLPHIVYNLHGILKYAWYSNSKWETETVDSVDYTSFTARITIDIDIDIDQNDIPHVSYHDGDGFNLKYATKVNGTWSAVVVDTVDDVGSASKIRVSSDGTPHIVYWDDTNDILKHAVPGGFGWSTSLLPPLDPNISQVADLLAIEIDSNGLIHILYLEFSDLWYASHDTSNNSWQATQRSDIGDIRYASLTLDQSDNPHICFNAWYDGLFYGYKTPGGWASGLVAIDSGLPDLRFGRCSMTISPTGEPSITSYLGEAIQHYRFLGGYNWELEGTVDDDPEQMRGDVDLELDQSGFPHIAYEYLGQAGYAYWNGELWKKIHLEDFTAYSTNYVSMKLDMQGQPHIATSEAAELVYYQKSGDTFSSQIIPNLGVVGNLSIAVDQNNHPHIAYQETGDGDLRYVFNDGSNWQQTTIESVENVGGNTRLVLDATNTPHILYEGWGELHYTYWDGNSWIIENFADSLNGHGHDIALAADNNPVIVFNNYAGSEMTFSYAMRSAQGWTVENIGEDIAWGVNPSLALDSEGNPHVVFKQYEGQFDVSTLYYARKVNGQWIVSIIESGISTNSDDIERSSVKIDSSDDLHIGFERNYSLKYLSTSTVASPFDFSSLVSGGKSNILLFLPAILSGK